MSSAAAELLKHRSNKSVWKVEPRGSAQSGLFVRACSVETTIATGTVTATAMLDYTLWPYLLVAFFLFSLIVGGALFLRYLPQGSILWYKNENMYLDPRTNEKKPFPPASVPPQVYLSLIVPAYNEEKRMTTMLDETRSYLEQRSSEDPGFTYEIVIVDDGSRDRTTEVALSYARQHQLDKIRVLQLAKNRGKGGAVRRGMLVARGKYMLMVDADGATKFADLDRLEKRLQQAETNGLGVAVGSRYHLQEKDAVAQRTFLRKLLQRGFHMLVMFCVADVRDTQCGFKLFTRKSAQLLFSNLHIERWAFDVELLFLAQQLDMPIEEVPVNWQEIAGSTLNPLTASIQMAKDIFYIRTLYLLGYWKISQ